MPGLMILRQATESNILPDVKVGSYPQGLSLQDKRNRRRLHLLGEMLLDTIRDVADIEFVYNCLRCMVPRRDGAG